MKEIKFSVLISTYIKEKPEYLDKALESILDKQILKPNEVVLIKDGKLTEKLDEVIDKYKNKYGEMFKIIPLEKNCGLGEALRIGIENCSFEYIARMDSDDISKPERFKEQIEFIKNNPEYDVVGTLIEEFENELEIKRIRKVPENSLEIKKRLKIISCINHPTVIFKKSSVLKAGNYSSKFHYLEDYYLWIRMSNEAKFYNMQKSLLYFRVVEDTYKRRGGIKFFFEEIKFQKELLRIGFICKKEYLKNIMIRGIFRITPYNLRRYIQKNFLRKSI